MISEFTHNKCHQFDILLTNDSTSVLQTSVSNLDISDHKLIQFKVPIKTDTTYSYKLVEFRDYNGINFEKFMIELNDQMHANIFPNNFEKAPEHYNNCIKTAIDKQASRKTKKIKNVPSCPWFNHDYA